MYVARLKHVLQGKYEKPNAENISQIKCVTRQKHHFTAKTGNNTQMLKIVL